MVRELLADSVPIRLGAAVMAVPVELHRAGVAADKIGNGDGRMHAMFLMEWLGTLRIILIAQCDAVA